MTGSVTSGSHARGLVLSDYWEKWPVTFAATGSLNGRKEGSR
jgi:hypothetical protein